MELMKNSDIKCILGDDLDDGAKKAIAAAVAAAKKIARWNRDKSGCGSVLHASVVSRGGRSKWDQSYCPLGLVVTPRSRNFVFVFVLR